VAADCEEPVKATRAGIRPDRHGFFTASWEIAPHVDEGRRPVRRLRTLALVVLVSGLFAALGYGAALTRASSGDSEAEPPTAPVTAKVELRRIRSSVVTRGDAGFADPVTVSITPSAPVPVITRTPVEVGDVVGSGQVLIEVAGRPVLLLPGVLPAYRDLGDGDTGPDVLQLEQALSSLGYYVGTVDDEYTASTGAAVDRLYEDRDYRPPTGESESASSDPADAPSAPATGRSAGHEPPPPPPVTPLPMSEVAFAPTLPRRVDQLPGHVGVTLPTDPIMLSGTTLEIALGLTAADVDELHAGMRAVVDLPGGGHVAGKLSGVRPTATGGAALVKLTDLGDKARVSLQHANVRVTVPLQASAGKVMVVPVAALSTDAGGAVHVVRVDADGSSHPVAVQLGLAADGYAAVTPRDGGLKPDDRVVVGAAP
jgi:peptidoglycan hydrolase-like protein with peptidoglycan-binding domain